MSGKRGRSHYTVQIYPGHHIPHFGSLPDIILDSGGTAGKVLKHSRLPRDLEELG